MDAAVAISIARLQGLCAQHHGSFQDACVHFEEGMSAGLQALARDNQPGVQWLIRDLVAHLRLALADTYGCMVRPAQLTLCENSIHNVLHGLTTAVRSVAPSCAVLELSLQQLHRQDGEHSTAVLSE